MLLWVRATSKHVYQVSRIFHLFSVNRNFSDKHFQPEFFRWIFKYREICKFWNELALFCKIYRVARKVRQTMSHEKCSSAGKARWEMSAGREKSYYRDPYKSQRNEFGQILELVPFVGGIQRKFLWKNFFLKFF